MPTLDALLSVRALDRRPSQSDVSRQTVTTRAADIGRWRDAGRGRRRVVVPSELGNRALLVAAGAGATRRPLTAGVRRLDEGRAGRRTLWERGEQLAELCRHWLDRARERLSAAAPARSSDES